MMFEFSCSSWVVGISKKNDLLSGQGQRMRQATETWLLTSLNPPLPAVCYQVSGSDAEFVMNAGLRGSSISFTK